ncbi:MAG TPA: AMP-binding protein [Solirubrobacterales bacterium]|nr:AMP-binding protein [Solirubrobacterales bacterium]
MNFTEDVLESFPAARPALITVGADGERRVWGFGELIARSAGLSGSLIARGVGRGDVVMTLIGNRAEWVLSMLACFRIGAVALPCNTQLRRADLAHRVGTADPKLAIGEQRFLDQLPEGAPYMTLEDVAGVLDEDRPQEPPGEIAELDPDDPALIVFTSGTTGESRAAVHPQRYLTGQALQAKHWFGAEPGEIAWCTAATGWSKSARNSFIAPWLCGAVALLHDGRFDPDERLEICEREGVATLCQAPTEYRILAKRTELRPVESLRRLVSAGEPLNPEVIRAFREGLGLEIHDGYGQTETGALTGSLTGQGMREGSMGRPLPGIEVRIEDGELVLDPASCPTFFSGYLGSEPHSGEEPWHTGDLVSSDDDGYLWFEGRADDVIISSGYRIGPFEVESALLTDERVAEAAAVAAPDDERGSVVKAFVVLRSGEPGEALKAELQEHVKRTTAPYKYPREVEFTESLPKTASGKIRRAELRGRGT